MSIIDVNYHLVFVCPPYFVFWRLSNAVPWSFQTMCFQKIISWRLNILFGWSEFLWIKPKNCFGAPFLTCRQMKENHPKPKPNKRLLEKMIQNRARKQQQDRAGEDGRRPGEPILFNVGQRCLFVVLVIFAMTVTVVGTGQREEESVLSNTKYCSIHAHGVLSTIDTHWEIKHTKKTNHLDSEQNDYNGRLWSNDQKHTKEIWWCEM